MSTKTTFKRIALVAVAALGLSLVAVAPSNAVNLDVPVYEEAAFRTGSFVTAPATATVGTPVSAILKMSASCLLQGTTAYNNKPTGDLGYFVINASFTTQIDVAPVGTNLVTNSVDTVGTVPTGYTNSNANTVRWAASADNGYKNSLQGACIANTAPLTAYGSVTFTPDVAGTYVIVVLPKGATTGAVTWTVTAAAKAAANSTSTTSVASPENAGGGDDTDGVYGPMAANAANIASILVTASNGSTAPLLNSDALAKSATISGPGLLSWDGGTTKGRAVSSLKGTLAQTLLVYGDGTAGKATITITDGGFTKTEKITFYGSVATVTLTASKNGSVLPITGNTAGGGNLQNTVDAATITVTDANGNPVPGQNVYLVSSDRAVYDLNYTQVGPTGADGSIKVSMNGGLKAGSFTVTATTNATSFATTGKSSSPVSFRVSDGKPTLVKLTINGSSNAEVPRTGRWTSVVALSNAAGPLPAGCYQLATNPTTPNEDGYLQAIYQGISGERYGMWWDTQVCVDVDGSYRNASSAYYLAESSGPAVRIAAGSGITGITFDIATITVTGDAAVAAATDAAAEATDAANAATDAANAAAEAADAATAAAQDAADAVAALSTQVAEMIDALKKQITALTNLVIKIQKKVKA